MATAQTPPTLANPEDWPEPTDEQVELVRRVLAPLVHQVRAERAEQQSAARGENST
ncbi:hypothetical protein [Streptomyces sp. SudanB25_2051]|uniref:hypothetical protein n=1 Tax=Streptomyces sp. SudanB25_2051 TaxID=3035275 RepID=UPI003F57CFD0